LISNLIKLPNIKEPESKTDVATTIGIGIAAVLIGAVIVLALKK